MIKKYKILQIALGLFVMMSATQGYAQSGVKYPYIQGGDKASNIIVSRDASGGVDPSCIHENWTGATPRHYVNDPENKVPAKLEVATSDATDCTWEEAHSICPSGWRLPTQRELMLIFVMRDRLKTANFSNTLWYWAATKGGETTAWNLMFSNGYYYMDTRNDWHDVHVRCVRDVN